MSSEAATAGTATMSAGDVGSGELGESASESNGHGEENVNAECGDGLVEGDEACDDAGEFPDMLRAIELGGTVATAACGEQHCCAILELGDLRCWGGNGDGQLGLGHAEAIGDDEVPSAAAELDIVADLTSIALGQHSCVLSAEGRRHTSTALRATNEGDKSIRLGRQEQTAK